MVSRFEVVEVPGGLRWRLTSGNHRVMGVGPHAREDVAGVLAELGAVRTAAQQGPVVLQRVSAGWVWRLGAAGAVVATSNRAFARRVEAALSADRFRELAVAAEVAPVAALRPRGGPSPR